MFWVLRLFNLEFAGFWVPWFPPAVQKYADCINWLLLIALSCECEWERFFMLVLQYISDLPSVYPAFCLESARIYSRFLWDPDGQVI